MMTHRRSVVLLAGVFVLAAVGGFALAASDGGLVAADHGAEDADYTVEPMEPEDRQPGATGVRYGQLVVAQAGVDLETIEQMEAVYDGGSWSTCGPQDAEEFGIDRGNTLDGYEVDEGLEENIQSFSAGEDVFQVDFYGEDDFGASTHFDDGDALVSVAACLQNPDEPGWYQISGSTTGVTEDGEERTFSSESHYFWICDCEDEEEAREELGPPPSEEDAGADGGDGEAADEDEDADEESAGDAEEEDADATAEGADGTDGGDGTADEETADDVTDEEQTDGEEADADGEGTTGESDGSSADGEDSTPAEQSVASEETAEGDGEQDDQRAGEQNWDDERVQTPTPAQGDGFGPLVALAGVLGAMLLLRRR